MTDKKDDGDVRMADGFAWVEPLAEDNPSDSWGLDGTCGWCGKTLHPQEIEEGVCDDCLG